MIDGRGSLGVVSVFATLGFGGCPIMARKVNQALWDQWRQRIGRQRASGLSVAAFCRKEDLSQAAFHRWKRKLRPRRTAGRSSTAARRPSPGAATTRRPRKRPATAPRRRKPKRVAAGVGAAKHAIDFLELPVQSVRSSPWIELSLVDGTVVRIPQENLAALVTLLKVLRGNDPAAVAGEVGHA
jgi:hypothetical protein